MEMQEVKKLEHLKVASGLDACKVDKQQKFTRQDEKSICLPCGVSAKTEIQASASSLGGKTSSSKETLWNLGSYEKCWFRLV